MFFTLILQNENGEQIDMTATANRYMTSKISGLHPPPGTVSTSSYAGMDGSYLNNAFIEKRNLVISFEMRGVGLEKRRHDLYRVVKPSRYIKVFYKTSGIDVYTEGYVETCEIDNFQTHTNGQISILCPDPYWYSTTAIHACYSRVSGGFFFPFPQSDEPFVLGSYSTTDNIEIRNDGDETGFIIQIEAVTDVTVPEIATVTPTIYNADTGEYLQIKGEILRGDIITISTKTGNKTVTLTRNGVDSNIINWLVAGSTWLTLREGLNTFHVQAVRNVKNLKITLMHTNAYLGV